MNVILQIVGGAVNTDILRTAAPKGDIAARLAEVASAILAGAAWQ